MNNDINVSINVINKIFEEKYSYSAEETPSLHRTCVESNEKQF